MPDDRRNPFRFPGGKMTKEHSKEEQFLMSSWKGEYVSCILDSQQKAIGKKGQ